jgi:hypothetical protein
MINKQRKIWKVVSGKSLSGKQTQSKTSESLIESLDLLYYKINILLNIKNKIK